MKVWKWMIIFIFILGIVGCKKVDHDDKRGQTLEGNPHVNEKEKNSSYGVSASHPIAVEEGMNVLREGGNAVDAAIAIAYVLGVVEPYGSGIGGGGGMLIVRGNGDNTFVDYRETASSERDTLSGVPGFVAGMQFVHEEYGSLSMKRLIQPAITYAEKGFVVDPHLASRLELAKSRIFSSKLAIFYEEGKALREGATLVQKSLAKTLEKIQEEGIGGFYRGEIADAISSTVKIPLEDMKKYTVEERQPVIGTYKDYDVYTAPPPFSGVTLLQMLKLLEREQTYEKKEREEKYIEEFGEIMKVTYKDRSLYSGDPNFIKIDLDKRMSETILKKMQKEVTEIDYQEHELVDVEEHESTTHFVVMDKEGTVVSVTNTLGNFFGSGAYTDGFFLNSQIAQFKSNPNDFEVGKRSRTFTSPTILVNEKEIMGIGSPGGNRIPQIIAQVLDTYTNEKTNMQSIVDQERFTLEKNVVYTEFVLPKEQRRYLEKAGYDVVYKYSPMFYGGIQALRKDIESGEIEGAGDKRRSGSWDVYKEGEE
jgi:gamma-glutamyltranspeptidase / glutathione hydrolase